MTGARRVRGSRRARAYPAATVPLLLAVFATCIAPAAVAVDVSTGAELLAAVNNATEGEIKLKANITTPFEWTQAGVYIKRDLVIESDSAVCGDTGCWITGPTTTSRDFVRVDDGATVTMRKIYLDKHGDLVAPFTYEGGAIRVVNGTLIAEDCGFIDNAGNYGGAVDVNANGYATFERCTFIGNVAYKEASGIDGGYRAGGAVRFVGGGVLTDCEFRGNHGMDGAAVHVSGASVKIERTVFVDNEDPSSSGGARHLYLQDSAVVSLFDSSFTTTTVSKQGNEMYASSNSRVAMLPYTAALAAQEDGTGTFVLWSSPPPPSPPPSPSPPPAPNPPPAAPPPPPTPPSPRVADPLIFNLADVEVYLVVGGLGAMLFFFVASRVVKCAFDKRRTVKKLERRAKLRRQMELRLRRTMLRRVARRLADDAVQYARLAEETGGDLSNRGNLSGNIRGHSQTGPVARRAVGSPVAALDLGIVEIARSPRVASPRGTDSVRANRGWRGPGSFLEYQRGDEDGGSPASPTSPSARGDTQSGVRTPARVAASRAAAAAAAAQAVALAAAKLAILAEQQLRDAEAELSSNGDGDDDDDEFMKELAETGKGGADGGGVGGSGASTPGGGGGVRLDRGGRDTGARLKESEREVGDGTLSSALVGLSDVEIGLGDVDAPPGTYGSEGRGDSNDDLFDTITVPNSGASYRVSDAGGLDGAITDLGDAELEALYARSYERALMRADAEAAIAETRERVGRRSGGTAVNVRAPSAATRATRFGAPPRPPR
mmetsp:Transcript_9499/g.43258  ORF Transcript_9499/g.43258 Transcript_9499/m.43258 type:complete len:774 (-) Transcript_9499:80-2401(-)